MPDTALGWWGVPLAVGAGAIRVSTPFLFVSLGEVLTEKSGRINLGQEGILVMGAMCAYSVSYLTGSPWLGVCIAGLAGAVLGLLHAALSSLPRVNDVAVGIALMLFGSGLAFYLGKPFIQPHAPTLPALSLGWWSHLPQVQAALQVNVLFLLGTALALVLWWALNPPPRGPRSGCHVQALRLTGGPRRGVDASACWDLPCLAGGKWCRKKYAREVPYGLLPCRCRRRAAGQS